MVTIFEPFLVVLFSSLAKRGFGEIWNKSQTFSLLLELVVDYQILIFIIFMSTQYSTDKLQLQYLGFQIELPKSGWILIFMIQIFLATLLWKQSRKVLFASVNLKTVPDWIKGGCWNIPNLVFIYIATVFIFEVKAI